MSDVGVHGFEIPHEFVQPTRDMVIIRIPFPPEKVGSIFTPDQTRELLAHNVMAGRIAAMGPLAFQYKDGEGLRRQDVSIGDWVLIRPFAGTLVQGGTVMVNSGWRYVSSFQDVIGIIPADKMPKPEALLWDRKSVHEPEAPVTSANIPDNTREKIVYPKK